MIKMAACVAVDLSTGAGLLPPVKAELMSTFSNGLLASAMAANSAGFIQKWVRADRSGALLQELIAAILYADMAEIDPVNAILERSSIREAIEKNESLAEVVGADLPLALQTIRAMASSLPQDSDQPGPRRS
ncbi:hypothetical protein [Devosia submarina]|uniref:hypothetical protein n=1 Tax=Devosia submarina TaxID=1173082 RepID=UPI00130042D1|nr:hypothetical protein [Devosia submarina]